MISNICISKYKRPDTIKEISQVALPYNFHFIPLPNNLVHKTINLIIVFIVKPKTPHESGRSQTKHIELAREITWIVGHDSQPPRQHCIFMTHNTMNNFAFSKAQMPNAMASLTSFPSFKTYHSHRKKHENPTKLWLTGKLVGLFHH